MFHSYVMPIFTLMSEAVVLVDMTQGQESGNLDSYSRSTIHIHSSEEEGKDGVGSFHPLYYPPTSWVASHKM